jgi:hypothetical protein
MLIVVWTSYTAVAYLFGSVFTPTVVPPELLTWAGELNTDTLRANDGTTRRVQPPRAPVGHYHGVDRWFQPDRHNNCTTVGCHEPLPHTKRKEVRAFANLHATFLDCRTCHDANISGPVGVHWISTVTGREQETPALLRLMNELETAGDTIQNAPAEIHPTILEQLRAVIVGIGGDSALENLLVRIDTSQPGSPVWRQAVARLETELPNYTRGDYSAKIALRAPPEDLNEPTRRYLAAAPDSPEREKLNQSIHKSVISRPDACLTCHGDDPPRLDLAALGYPPSQVAALLSAPTVRLIQRTIEGEPFYLPRILEPDDAR